MLGNFVLSTQRKAWCFPWRFLNSYRRKVGRDHQASHPGSPRTCFSQDRPCSVFMAGVRGHTAEAGAGNTWEPNTDWAFSSDSRPRTQGSTELIYWKACVCCAGEMEQKSSFKAQIWKHSHFTPGERIPYRITGFRKFSLFPCDDN